MKTAVKERPILMAGRLVKAILDGKKTQTRRPVKPQPAKWIDRYSRSASADHWLPSGVYIEDSAGFLGRGRLSLRSNDLPVRCPFGAPGDRLWVRETWRWYGRFRADRPEGGMEYRADLKQRGFEEFDKWKEAFEQFDLAMIMGTANKWRPSIHMPRWACRLMLEITDVRVERIKDINADGCIAEGVPSRGIERDGPCIASAIMYIEDFKKLWDGINEKRGYGWAANPWVWAIEFKRVDLV